MISRVNRVIILSVWALIDQQDVMHDSRWSRAATLRPYMVHRPWPSEGGPRLKCRNGSMHRLEHVSLMEIGLWSQDYLKHEY
jgi:hypothetical protein